MLDWIFESMAQWVASVLTQILDACSGIFLNALGTDMTAMEEYFPFVTVAYDVLQYTAWALLFLITVWQLFRVFGGPITEAENPLHLLVRSALFAVLIGYAKPIFMLVLDIARGPYSALMAASMDPGDFTFAGIEQVLMSGITTIVATASIVGLIIIVVMLIALGWNYFKLMLEAIERYVLVGVLCFTSPLAYAMGGSKATQKVFQSWCRMVGSQMLLLIMNVWFLRSFNSAVGTLIANAGALSNGRGDIFLWLFCALAYLRIAQKFDSYLAALGLNVAQTGSGMGMEMMMAARAVTGFGGGRGSGSISRAGATASGAASTGGFMPGLAAMVKPNSFVRDAVVTGGTKIGTGGGIGFVGRTLGGMAARNGAALSGESVASVAARPPGVSGRIGGDIANRSVGNYLPHLAGRQLSGAEISGGHIRATATGEGGAQANVELFSAAQFSTPSSPYAVATASDGSQWYQMASGEAMGDFYHTPSLSGDAAEAAQIAEAFPSLAEGTSLRTVGEGTLEMNHPDSGSSLMLSSAHYEKPDAPHDTVSASNGLTWYAMHPHAQVPQFEAGAATAAMADEAQAFDQALFRQHMPGYTTPVSTVDASRRDEGMMTVRHADGSGAQFYDQSRYQPPRGDYQVYEDRQGGQWYAIQGTPTVERRPVYEDGKPVYDGDVMRTVNVEGMRYKSTLTRYEEPKRREVQEIKPPKRKQGM